MTSIRVFPSFLLPLSPLTTHPSPPAASFFLAQIAPLLVVKAQPPLFSIQTGSGSWSGPICVLYNYTSGSFGFSRAFEDVFVARTGRRISSDMDARTDPDVVALVLEKGSTWSSGPDVVLEMYTMDPMFKSTWSLNESRVAGSDSVLERVDPGIDKLLTRALFRHLSLSEHENKHENEHENKSDELLRREVSTILEAGQRSRRRTMGGVSLLGPSLGMGGTG